MSFNEFHFTVIMSDFSKKHSKSFSGLHRNSRLINRLKLCNYYIRNLKNILALIAQIHSVKKLFCEWVGHTDSIFTTAIRSHPIQLEKLWPQLSYLLPIKRLQAVAYLCPQPNKIRAWKIFEGSFYWGHHHLI